MVLGVNVMVGVGVMLGVSVIDGVRVMEGVSVIVGVVTTVGEALAVGVAVIVRVRVRVSVPVRVGVVAALGPSEAPTTKIGIARGVVDDGGVGKDRAGCLDGDHGVVGVEVGRLRPRKKMPETWVPEWAPMVRGTELPR